MAVFTPVSLAELRQWMTHFSLGQAHAIKGIESGIENSNFFITTDAGEFVLTIFERLSFQQLPFYLNLMRHLADRQVLVPAPVANVHGDLLGTLHGKPASIVTKLTGSCQLAPEEIHCAEVGRMLAKMHLAGQDFALVQPNLRGLPWWRETTPVVLPFLSEDSASLLCVEMQFQEAFAASDIHAQLPRGPVHADLFRNNVMFDGARLSGFFDFYFAGCDTWLFDVAVTVNDWCIDLASGQFDAARLGALLAAYHAARPFSDAEKTAWQGTLRAAGLRFWLSRLYDFYRPREAEILTPHDPRHFERIVRDRARQIATPLF